MQRLRSSMYLEKKSVFISSSHFCSSTCKPKWSFIHFWRNSLVSLYFSLVTFALLSLTLSFTFKASWMRLRVTLLSALSFLVQQPVIFLPFLFKLSNQLDLDPCFSFLKVMKGLVRWSLICRKNTFVILWVPKSCFFKSAFITELITLPRLASFPKN